MLIPRVLVFVIRGDSVLLIKGSHHKRLWADKYNGIGGHLERGEDVLFAAQREFLEETGLHADLHLCGMVIVETGTNPGVGMNLPEWRKWQLVPLCGLIMLCGKRITFPRPLQRQSFFSTIIQGKPVSSPVPLT